MSETAKLTLGDKTYDLPVVTGTENEKAVVISKLRAQTNYITLDDGYGNTGSCESKVTFIDGEAGILRYRGYPIDQLAEHSSFMETAYLLINGELPTEKELAKFRERVAANSTLHFSMRKHFDAFPETAHPMAVLASMIHATGTHYPHLYELDTKEKFEEAASILLAHGPAIAAFHYKKMRGEQIMPPRPDLTYTRRLLHMMFSRPYYEYLADDDIASALDLILVLHADHEQNCSTSTVRMVASSQANIFASIAAGVSALWGPLHGGANQAVLEMLSEIHSAGLTVKDCVARAKDKNSGFRLMGFGHRVYKNFDPRAKIIKAACDRVLHKIGVTDPLLDIAKQLEEAALHDSYFVERKLYPNVDFYSGIIMRALNIPVNMFTVMFAIGRMPGWIAQFREVHESEARIYRPRQIYQGATIRDYPGAN